MKLTKTHVFLIALTLGIVAGNLLTTYTKSYQRKTANKATDEVLFMLYEIKSKSNEDSVKYNDKIAEISAQYYRLELENRELKENLGFSDLSHPK